MKNFFNKLSDAIIGFFIIVILVLLLPILLVLLAVKTIKDYSIYRGTFYFQDTHEKYTWLCGESQYIQFYDAIISAEVPIEYYRDNTVRVTGFGYFVYNDILFLCDYDSDNLFFDKDQNEWFVYDSDDYLLLEVEINETINNVNTFLGENKCNQAVLFLKRNMLEDIPEKHYEGIRFLPIANNDIVSALRKFFV